jgi:UDP-N-acetylglucosamine---dolichyl-phosphate N-acetylglucosaminyltransferase
MTGHAPSISVLFAFAGKKQPVMARSRIPEASQRFRPAGMPYRRRLANWTANVVTYLLFGGWTTDSQSGLRGFSNRAATQMQIITTGMEVSSEIIAEMVRKRLQWREVPIKAIYTDYSLSKGQSFMVGLRTLMHLLRARVPRSML